jgi:parallel beta-helix repeat protein
MFKPSALIIVFMLLFSSVSLVGVGLVEAAFMPLEVPSHSIEITSDGSIIGTNSIICRGTDYEFTGNVSGNMVIFCDNIVINGNGYWLEGNGVSYGLFLEGRKNVTVKNLTIHNFDVGVGFSYAKQPNGDCSDNHLIATNILNNTCGVYCYQVGRITLFENQISNCSYGLSSLNSNSIYVYGNTLSNNEVAIRFTFSIGCFVYGNNFLYNTVQTQVDPESKSGLNYGWSTITWDNKRMGNFWSDYTGLDTTGGNIVDNPYVIDKNNTDFYPQLSLINDTSLILPPNGSEFEMSWGSILIALTIVIAITVLVVVFFSLRKRKCVSFSLSNNNQPGSGRGK